MSKVICTENDANCPSYSNKQCTFDGHCSLKEEENKMKCPRCGKDGIQDEHPSWYSWLQSKGLVQKKKVKREAWVNVYYGKLSGYEIGHSYISEKEAKENAFDRKDKRHIKTILLHSWEE